MNVFKKAHELTREIIKTGDNYKATFRLCLIFVYAQIKKGVNKMVELTGTEKQVQWANDLRNMTLEYVNNSLESKIEKRERMIAKGKATPKTDLKISQLNTFMEKVKNENDASIIIKDFKFMMDRNFDGMSKTMFLEDMIYGVKED